MYFAKSNELVIVKQVISNIKIMVFFDVTPCILVDIHINSFVLPVKYQIKTAQHDKLLYEI
jgi:hypothetical protein